MTEKSDTWCYITRFVCCFDALPSAKQRYQERLREVRKKFRVVLASEQAFNLGQSSLFFEQGLKEAYSASAKTHLHQQAEKQKEHAIHLGLPYSQKLIRHREAE